MALWTVRFASSEDLSVIKSLNFRAAIGMTPIAFGNGFRQAIAPVLHAEIPLRNKLVSEI